jgi:hypothetical protein
VSLATKLSTNPIIQTLLIIAVSSVFTHVVELIGYRGPINGLLLAGVVIIVSVLCNRRAGMKMFMALLLLLVAFLTVGINAVIFRYP